MSLDTGADVRSIMSQMAWPSSDRCMDPGDNALTEPEVRDTRTSGQLDQDSLTTPVSCPASAPNLPPFMPGAPASTRLPSSVSLMWPNGFSLPSLSITPNLHTEANGQAYSIGLKQLGFHPNTPITALPLTNSFLPPHQCSLPQH